MHIERDIETNCIKMSEIYQFEKCLKGLLFPTTTTTLDAVGIAPTGSTDSRVCAGYTNMLEDVLTNRQLK